LHDWLENWLCSWSTLLIKAMIKIQGQSTSNPSSISQYAALAGISGSKEFLDPCLNDLNLFTKELLLLVIFGKIFSIVI